MVDVLETRRIQTVILSRPRAATVVVSRGGKGLTAAEQIYNAGLSAAPTTQAMIDYLINAVAEGMRGNLDFSNPNNSDLIA